MKIVITVFVAVTALCALVQADDETPSASSGSQREAPHEIDQPSNVPSDEDLPLERVQRDRKRAVYELLQSDARRERQKREEEYRRQWQRNREALQRLDEINASLQNQQQERIQNRLSGILIGIAAAVVIGFVRLIFELGRKSASGQACAPSTRERMP